MKSEVTSKQPTMFCSNSDHLSNKNTRAERKYEQRDRDIDREKKIHRPFIVLCIHCLFIPVLIITTQ